MGVADILAGMKKNLRGTVKFIFQPAEEGPPKGEKGGAALMIEEGVLDDPKVEAMFALHMNAQVEVDKVTYRPGGFFIDESGFKTGINALCNLV